MPHAARLAMTLDEEMLIRNGVTIVPPTTPDSKLPHCIDLADQLSGRSLIKYVRTDDRHRYSVLSSITHFPGVHYLTPTPLCREAVTGALNLPPFATPRYALVLDPTKLTAHGPRRIRGGSAIEYVLLNGFPADAIVPPGWPVEVG